MQTFWDLSEKDRAALTEAEVEQFIAAELMTKGVLRAKPLELLPEPTLPEPERDVFTIRAGGFNKLDIAFDTAEAAREALRHGFHMTTEFFNSTSAPYAKPLRSGEDTIVAERVHSKEQLDAARKDFEMHGHVLVKPHGNACGTRTTMGRELAETYARNPQFYSGTFCVACKAHFPVGEDGEFVREGTTEKVGT
jgi:hypothetical protein